MLFRSGNYTFTVNAYRDVSDDIGVPRTFNITVIAITTTTTTTPVPTTTTPIFGTVSTYTPSSVPCTSNRSLFLQLVRYYSWVNSFVSADTSAINSSFGYKDYAQDLVCNVNCKILSKDQLTKVNVDFAFTDFKDTTRTVYVKLNQDGRFWYAVLRGLGYSCDFTDERPVSALPFLLLMRF